MNITDQPIKTVVTIVYRDKLFYEKLLSTFTFVLLISLHDKIDNKALRRHPFYRSLLHTGYVSWLELSSRTSRQRVPCLGRPCSARSEQSKYVIISYHMKSGTGSFIQPSIKNRSEFYSIRLNSFIASSYFR